MSNKQLTTEHYYGQETINTTIYVALTPPVK